MNKITINATKNGKFALRITEDDGMMEAILSPEDLRFLNTASLSLLRQSNSEASKPSQGLTDVPRIVAQNVIVHSNQFYSEVQVLFEAVEVPPFCYALSVEEAAKLAQLLVNAAKRLQSQLPNS